MEILITGGAGYIGAHVARVLAEQGHAVAVLDRGLAASPNRKDVRSNALDAWDYDLCDHDWKTADALKNILRKPWDAIIHLAAVISVAESVENPVMYWRNNLMSTARVMDNLNPATHLIFASTGTAFCPENAYAYSKVACEQEILSRQNLGGHTIFRYYNVSGLGAGLKQTGPASHLIRRAAMVARGEMPEMTVWGTDWDTRDGTCIRDYIHVEDLAETIAKAVEVGPAGTMYECLGSGTGSTVLEVIESMKRVTGVDFRVTMAPRRPGDVASMVCEDQYKHIQLSRTLDDMCLSAYENK